MMKNVGETDQTFRYIAATILFSLVLIAPGEWRWLALLGLLPLATGIARFCPLYTILGMTTCDKETHNVQKHPGSN